MISGNELLEIKERLLVAAAATRRLVESNEPRVLYEEEQYWRVHVAFSSLGEDVAALLTELDVLRAMFRDRVNDFLAATGGTPDATGGSSGDRENSGDDLAGVPERADISGGGAAQPDAAEVGVATPAKRPPRRRKPRSVKGGDTAGLPDVPAAVDRRSSEGSLGGSEVD